MNFDNKILVHPKSLLALATSLYVSAVGMQAQAQNSQDLVLEEILVTARFKEESIQDIGGAVSALGAEAIARRGIIDLADMSAQIAGLDIRNAGPNENDISIRGIGRSTRNASSGTSPLVAVYLDDLPITSSDNTQKNINTFDLERIEVLRGPQPTFFGEGAVGGVIRYVTRSPDLEGSGSLRLGQTFSDTTDGDTGFLTEVGGEIVLVPGKFGVSGSLYYREDGGYTDNPTLGYEDGNQYTSQGGNLTALFQASERLNIRAFARVMDDEVDDSYFVDGQFPDADSLINSAPVRSDLQDEFGMFGFKADYESDVGTFSLIGGVIEREREVFEFNWINEAINALLGLPPFTLAPTTGSTIDEENHILEARFVSGWEGPFSLTGGLFYKDYQYDILSTLVDANGFAGAVFGNDLLFRSNTYYDREQYSAFLEGSYDISDKLTVIAGARYVDEELQTPSLTSLPGLPFGDEVPDGGSDRVFDLSELLPRFAVEYQVNDDLLAYGSYSEGIRNGGLNNNLSATNAITVPGETRTFDDVQNFSEDRLTTYELGVKNTFMDGRATLNAAVFFSEFDDPQTFEQNPFAFVENGPDAEIFGVELEGSAVFTDNLSGFVSVSYMDAEYVEDAPFPGQIILNGGQMPGVPEWQGALGGDWTTSLGSSGWSAYGSFVYSYVGERLAQNPDTPNRAVNSLELLDLRLGVSNKKFNIFGFVDNALNDVEAGLVSKTASTIRGFCPQSRPSPIGLVLTA